MGQIVYGSGVRTISVDDVTLAYVKTVAVMKLRRNESFTISMRSSEPAAGALSVWVHPSIGLQFLFDEDSRVELDRGTLESLMQTTNRTGDLRADPIESAQNIPTDTRTSRVPAKRTMSAPGRVRVGAAA